MEDCGIPHLAKNERDAPNFLHVALDKSAYAPFFKETRIWCTEPTKLHKKSGMWGTRHSYENGLRPVFFGPEKGGLVLCSNRCAADEPMPFRIQQTISVEVLHDRATGMPGYVDAG